VGNDSPIKVSNADDSTSQLQQTQTFSRLVLSFAQHQPEESSGRSTSSAGAEHLAPVLDMDWSPHSDTIVASSRGCSASTSCVECE
jgi:hypothetical protein